MTANPLKMVTKAGVSGLPADPIERQRVIIEEGNARLMAMGRPDLHWTVRNGSYRIEQISGARDPSPMPKRDLMDRRGEPMSPTETAHLNHILEGLGVTARYRSDGSRYMVSGHAEPRS